MAEMQRRRPSRMDLSPRVAQAPPRTAPSGKPIKRRMNSPFGGMNMTEPKIRGQPRERSQAEEKRSSRYRDKERPREEKGRPEPFKALKMQRALAPVSYGHRTSVKSRISDIDTFDQFDLLPVIQQSIAPQALRAMDSVTPTPIQRLSIPALLGSDTRKVRRRNSMHKSEEMEQFLLAAETGSGKTLAYLLPVVDAIKRAEVEDTRAEERERAQKEVQSRKNPFELESPPLSNEPHSTTGRPRAIILLPTSELVAQVGSLVKSLSHTVKFRSALISASFTGQVIRNRLFSPNGIDVLISTPHLLSSIAESDPNVLSRVTHLVIDEADSLLDRSFSPLTSAIIDKATPSLQQLILCSATIPRSLDSFLRKRFPDIRRLVTPNLHAIPRRVQLGVVDVDKEPYRGNKNLACADTIWSIGKTAEEHSSTYPGEDAHENVDVKRIIVFVNEREKTLEVAEHLLSKGIDAVALSRDTDERKQSEILASFTTATEARDPGAAPPQALKPNYVPMNQAAAGSPRRMLPNTKVLVITDLGSRGIDTLAVRHVILYDVPHTTIDFIHRLGRTGRMGRRGRGVVLVGKGDRKDVVREVREGMFKGQALI
ncbi:ATP-dependent RNA helicase mrh4, mitochondrial [Cryomyces minteri]|uniref:RNA helicase n=1 Tax=Cryomyces minteri TaxID=331657 RepID=A0A4U0XXV4_9PEZI|nr:ATP-dependent RNA helicase mrh4, mitochondrial [Cryomyces minteri]